MQIGVPRETAAGETRVAATPETVKKLAALGHTVRVESQAGVAASAIDSAYSAVGAEITDRAGAFGCELVLKVRAPNADELRLMKPGTNLVGMLNPFDRAGLDALAAAGITAGLLFSIVRIMQGAQFASATLWSAVVDWTVCAALFLPLLCAPKKPTA